MQALGSLGLAHGPCKSMCCILRVCSWEEDSYLPLCFQEIKIVGLEEQRKEAPNLWETEKKRKGATCARCREKWPVSYVCSSRRAVSLYGDERDHD